MGLKKYGVILLKLAGALLLLLLLLTAILFVITRPDGVYISEPVALGLLIAPFILFIIGFAIISVHWYIRSYLPWINARIKEKEEGRR